MSFLVAKVGGSLFGLPDLAERIRRWVSRPESSHILLVPGGGRFADEVRRLDVLHSLGEEKSHWLAVQAMSVAGRFLAGLLDGDIVREKTGLASMWSRKEVAILDAEAFCRADESSAGRLPHRWEVTSDSIAARVAVTWGADRLTLLKPKSPSGSVEDWAHTGYCDAWLPRVLADSKIAVSAVNLRNDPQ